MSGLAYLATGFAVVWFFLACYLYWMGHRQRALLARLERLESEMISRARLAWTPSGGRPEGGARSRADL